MANGKSTFQELVNQILVLILQDPVSDDISTILTGHARIVADKFNYAQKVIYNKTNWYSLFKERRFQTSKNVTITVIDYTALGGDTLSLTYNGVVTVLTEGVEYTAQTSNTVTAASIAAALITAFGSTVVEASSENSIVVLKNMSENNVGFTVATPSDVGNLTSELTSNGLYSMDSQFGRSISLCDIVQDLPMTEKDAKFVSMNDANDTEVGSPYYFATFGNHYRIFPTPSSLTTMIDRFYKVPAMLTTNAQFCDLPVECEPLLLKLVEAEMSFYLNKSVKGTGMMAAFKLLVEDAVEMNELILDKLNIFGDGEGIDTRHPQLPSEYRFKN